MYRFPFLDFKKLNNLMAIPSENKIACMYKAMGGQFHDDEKELMSGAVVGIVSIGGIPVEVENGIKLLGRSTTSEKIKQQFNETVGMSSFMSYLNPKNKSLDDLGESTLELGHTSVLHTVSLSILVVGLSIGVEHEISSQRDLVHLSRLTVAKTKAQNNPCLVLRNPKYYALYKEVLKNTKEALAKVDQEDLETRNLIYPSSKASAIMITGSLKNIMKLVSLKDAGGKEAELVEVLTSIEKAIHFLK